MKKMTSLAACAAIGLCAAPLYLRAEDEIEIAVRKPTPLEVPAAPKPREKSEFADYLLDKAKEPEFNAQMKKIVERFKRGNLTELEKKDIEDALGANPERTAKALAPYFDWLRTPDVFVRIAAYEALKLVPEAPGKIVGGPLGSTAMNDPAPQMRAAAIALIKERNDRLAVRYVFAVMLKSMENGESPAISNGGQQAAAIAALKEIGCKQTYAALLYYAKVAKAQGITGSVNLDGVKIDAPNVDLPITVANNEVGAFNSVQTFPGLSLLKQLTGEDFQNDYKKWQEWIDRQPNYKK
jgi:hypothetical protein